MLEVNALLAICLRVTCWVGFPIDDCVVGDFVAVKIDSMIFVNRFSTSDCKAKASFLNGSFPLQQYSQKMVLSMM